MTTADPILVIGAAGEVGEGICTALLDAGYPVPDPRWFTAREVGELVRDIYASTDKFPGPVWRISRRDESGRPVVGAERPQSARNLPL